MYFSVLSFASITFAQNSSKHFEIASYYDELYCSAVLRSCLAAIPLLCMKSWGKFFGLRSVIVHLQSSTLKAGSFFSSSSAGGYCYCSSSSSPSPGFFTSTGSGSGNSSYWTSYSSIYSFSELNYSPIQAWTSPICLSIWNNSSMKRSSRRSSSKINLPELQNPSSKIYF
jgi:hypothetical protein